jgi:hypothetical protein
MTLSKTDERTNNGVINIGEKHNDLKQKRRTTNTGIINIGGQHNDLK